MELKDTEERLGRNAEAFESVTADLALGIWRCGQAHRCAGVGV